MGSMAEKERLNPDAMAQTEGERSRGAQAKKYILLTCVGVAIGVFAVAMLISFFRPI
jgi:hypothetical protein